MKIDEFETTLSTFASSDITRWLLVGFDIGLAAASTSFPPQYQLLGLELADGSYSLALQKKSWGVVI